MKKAGGRSQKGPCALSFSYERIIVLLEIKAVLLPVIAFSTIVDILRFGFKYVYWQRSLLPLEECHHHYQTQKTFESRKSETQF